MSVIGFDDIHLAEFVYPPLTTVRMSRSDLARGAFEALRSVAENDERPESAHLLNVSTTLIVRQSTAPVSASKAGKSHSRASARKRAAKRS
jgi:DNA-binding LacI/PurR family transcriptional regulator